MGGIGEYVHYRFSNYQKFGTAYKGEHSSISAAAALGQARTQLKSMIKSSTQTMNTKEIETFLNSLIYGSSGASIGNISLSASEIEDHKKYFTQLIQEKIPRLGAVLDSVGLNNISSSGTVGGLDKLPTSATNKIGVMSHTVGKAQNNMLTLINAFKAQQEDFERGSTDWNRLNALMQEVNTLYSQLGALQADYQGRVITFTQKVSSSNGKTITAEDLFKRYNELIKLASQPTMKDYGDIAEIYFQYMLNAAAQSTKGGLKEVLSPLTTAGQKNVATIGLPNISSEVNVEVLLSELNMGKNLESNNNRGGRWKAEADGYGVDIYQKGSTSQQTVDIAVKFRKNSRIAKAFGVNDLKASVKNVGKFKQISILKEAPLSSAFALFDTNFVNHYLNLLASHPDSSGGGSAGKKYSDTIKLGMALRALQGRRDASNSLGLDLSDCLIVNKKGYGIKIIDTHTLMTNIYHNLDNYISVKGMPSVISQSWSGYKNRPNKGDAYTRIAKLIAATNAIKLSLTLKQL